MRVPSKVLAAHENLSQASLKFAEHAARDRELWRRFDFTSADASSWALLHKFPLQCWPTIVGKRKLEEVSTATVELCKLVKSVPARIFDNDPKRISEYYRIGDEELTAKVLEEPTGIEEAMARGDFLDAEDGFKCVEINVSPSLGGLQFESWKGICLNNPAIQRFLRDNHVELTCRNPLATFFRVLVDRARERSICDRGELNVAVLLKGTGSFQLMEAVSATIDSVYERVRQEHGELDGEVLYCTKDDLESRAGRLHVGNQRIGALIEYGDMLRDRRLLESFKDGHVLIYNGPSKLILRSKLNMALLSTHQESDRFDSAERRTLARHLPWTREVARVETTYDGEVVDLPAFIRSHRDRLVLKPAFAMGGQGVLLGRHASRWAWRKTLRRALSGERWLVQERVDSREYLYQCGEDGCRPHKVAWGLFSFDGVFGGGFLRMMPRGEGAGVINATRGATEGILFETED